MSFTNRRVSIRDVTPQVDCGRFPAKATIGEPVEVEADIYADSHDVLRAAVRWRAEGSDDWHEVAMRHLVNDRWRGTFAPPEAGRYEFSLVAWIDPFATWQRDLAKKIEARVATDVDFQIGAGMAAAVVHRAEDHDDNRRKLERARASLTDPDLIESTRSDLALSDELRDLVDRYSDRTHATELDQILRLRVDRYRARFSTWYELFPRSTSPEEGRHGTFDDVIARLPYVQAMGFDVLYLPPIHPIGQSFRKGRDNSLETEPDDPGSPWAIGSDEGGHKAIHSQLGTFDDFQRLVGAAHDHGLEVALDIAFQCSPDHPWVTEHPQWFRHRPDGTIQYAENPPKKYQDIYPLNFDTDDTEGLWRELKSVFEFWIDQGVKIFRVDNPHTKSFPFWEWCIDELTRAHPDLIFLSEAFTRPKVMYELAKVGFTQSYTYFAWRDRKWELEQYYQELHTTRVADFFRPNSWPNTPDILTEFLQYGGRPAFVQKLVLAATLTASYGIYGPPFELMLNEARGGAEEYARNEKYEIHHWDLDQDQSLRQLIGRVNRIRRENPALQQDKRFQLHHIDNEQLLVYSKSTRDFDNVLLVVVNLDPKWRQSGFTWLDLEALGIAEDATFQVHDLLGGGTWLWNSPRNYIELDPTIVSAHIFEVRSLHRTEQDFEHYG